MAAVDAAVNTPCMARTAIRVSPKSTLAHQLRGFCSSDSVCAHGVVRVAIIISTKSADEAATKNAARAALRNAFSWMCWFRGRIRGVSAHSSTSARSPGENSLKKSPATVEFLAS